MAYNKLTPMEKLLAKARQEGDCLLWFGDKDSNGYGRIRWVGKKGFPAHRLMYELHHGPIPEGLVVRHRCDVRGCINIDHLELGTQKDNVHDMLDRGRDVRARGEAHGRAKLAQDQVAEIRRRYRRGVRGAGISSLAREFDVARSTLRSILIGKNWRHVP